MSPAAKRHAVAGARADRSGLLAVLGVSLDEGLLTTALTHRSYAFENGGVPHNERLEFLGDSVLGLSITERLYTDHPDKAEGELAKIRSNIVNMYALAEVALTLGDGGLGMYLRLGKGEEITGGREKTSIIADGVEALLGAVFIEHGINVARDVVLRLFADLLIKAPLRGAGLDWKTSLQELAAEREYGAPVYRVEASGPDHEKFFAATVEVAGQAAGMGEGRSKKEAEQLAAAAAWRALNAPAGG